MDNTLFLDLRTGTVDHMEHPIIVVIEVKLNENEMAIINYYDRPIISKHLKL